MQCGPVWAQFGLGRADMRCRQLEKACIIRGHSMQGHARSSGANDLEEGVRGSTQQVRPEGCRTIK